MNCIFEHLFRDLSNNPKMALAYFIIPIILQINSWTRTLGNGTEVKFYRKVDESAATAMDDTNPYWIAMKDVANEL